jgi:hypothetical protein
MSNNREALAILEELEVEVVAKNVMPRPGQTRSVATLQRIVRRHGVDHARMVIMLIMESVNNRAALDEASLGAVSDVLAAFKRTYPGIYEASTSDLFAFFDQTPIANIRVLFTEGLDGVVNKRSALAGQLWERLVRKFGQHQDDWLDDRRVSA